MRFRKERDRQVPMLKDSLVCLAENALPSLPLVVHRGSAGSLLCAGDAAATCYIRNQLFGALPCASESHGCVPAWRLPAALAAWRERVDIVCAAVNRRSACGYPSEEYIRTPVWIRMVARVPAADERGATSRAQRNQRVVLKNGLAWRVSTDPHDLRTFIERDYRPYISSRFGADAQIRSERWFRARFRRGGLMWIERGGGTVAGAAYDRCGTTIRLLALACARGDGRLLRIGALSAVYLALFELARSLGCELLDLRNCRPSLNDGLLQAKRSWGGVVMQPDDVSRDFVIGWRQSTPAVMRFCSCARLIVRDGNGFAALQGADPPIRPSVVPGGIGRLIAPVADGSFGEWIARDLPT